MTPRQASAGGALLLVAAALAYLATQLRIDADFSAFLPGGLTETQRIFIKQLQEGVAGRLLLIELRGDEPARLARISKALAERLARESAFQYVNNGADAGERELQFIAQHRYVLSDEVTPARFTRDGLRAALEERLEGLAGSGALLEKQFLAADPTGETLHILQRATPASSPRTIEGVWFNRTGDGALLITQTRSAGSDLEGQQAAIETLRQVFADVRDGSPASVRYSSPGVMAVESRALIASDAARLSVVSSLLVIGLLAWFYRSLPVVLLCIVPAAVGLLIAIAAVNAWFGGVHAITLGFGVTLLGEAVDYPSYLLTQVVPGETATVARKRILPTLRLAVLTTLCGSLALLMASFPGLAQLGLLAMAGVAVAGIVTYFLPLWIPSGWQGVNARIDLARVVDISPPSMSKRGIVLALLAGALIVAAPHPWWDDDLAHMNPLPDAFRQRDRELREALSASDVRSLVVIVGETSEDVLRTAERIRPELTQWVASGAIGGFDLVSDYVPSGATQALRQRALPPDDVLRANLLDAATGLPFRTDVFAPFIDAVEEARHAPPLTVESLTGTAFALKTESLLRRDGKRSVAIVPLSGVKDPAALAAKAAALHVAGVAFLDLRAESIAMMSSYRRHTLFYAAIGAVLIFVVMTQGLASPRRAWKAMLPIVVALPLTAATLVSMGQALSIFHIVALLLVLGIGINYALFFLRGVEGHDDFGRTVQTLALVSATTLCAFGTLAFSRMPVLHAIGSTVSLGIIFSLLASALLLGGPATAPRGPS